MIIVIGTSFSSKGVAIKLCHGLLIEWNGTKVKHCTMVPIISKETNLFGIMLGPKTKFVPKEHSRNPLNVASKQCLEKYEHLLNV